MIDRSEFEDRDLVLWDNPSKNIQSTIFGSEKITNLMVTEFNNLVEGVVLDDCIVINSENLRDSDSQFDSFLKKIMDLPLCSTHSLKEQDPPFVMKYFEVERLNRISNFFESTPGLHSFWEELADFHPYIGQICAKLAKEPKEKFGFDNIDKYTDYMCNIENKLGPSAQEEADDRIHRFLEKKGLIVEPVFDPINMSAEELSYSLKSIDESGVIDYQHLYAKSYSQAYFHYYFDKGINVRLPIQYRSLVSKEQNIGLQTSHEVYKSIANIHKCHVELIVKYGGQIECYVPPFLAILLDRCNSKKDLIPRMIEMREEYEGLRKFFNQFRISRLQCNTFGQHLDVILELESQLEAFSKGKYKERNKSYLYQAWNVVKSGNPLKIATGVIDLIASNSNNTKLKNLGSLSSVLDTAYGIKNYGGQLTKIFGSEQLDLK